MVLKILVGCCPCEPAEGHGPKRCREAAIVGIARTTIARAKVVIGFSFNIFKLSTLPGLENGVHLPVDAIVYATTGRVGVEPGDSAPNAFVEGDDGAKTRDETFDLAVVKNDAPALVPQQ